jgi:hypothetical protein
VRDGNSNICVVAETPQFIAHKHSFPKLASEMIYRVHLLAFGQPGQVRSVTVPDEQVVGSSTEGLLELIFKLGQNAAQPQQCTSASAGDVVELHDGTLWMMAAVGFRHMHRTEFDEYIAMEQRERCHAYLRFVK